MIPKEQEDPSQDEKWLQFRCDQITEVANMIADVVHSYGKKNGSLSFPYAQDGIQNGSSRLGEMESGHCLPHGIP